MSNLVQELREAAGKINGSCSMFATIAGTETNCGSIRCSTCMESTLNALADRIATEYDPKPEPDTVEKVARDMLDRMAMSESEELFRHYADRLEALGVTLDD